MTRSQVFEHSHPDPQKRILTEKDYQTRFKTFFEQSNLPMEIYSLDGYPLAVNKAWEDLFQTSREELIGYNIFNDPHTKNSSLGLALIEAIEGQAVDVPAFWYDPALISKPGRGRWLEAWISPVKDDQGTIQEIAMIIKDVTEKIDIQQALVKSISDRKATEDKFQILSDRMSMAVKAGNIGILEWIPNTNYVFIDETTEKMLGLEAGSFPRTSEALTDIIHPEDQNLFWLSVSCAIEDKKSYRLDIRARHQDGHNLWLQASGMALYHANGEAYHLMGTLIDITERVESDADQKFLSLASELLSGSLDHREILKTLSEHAITYFCDGVFIDQLQVDGQIKRLMVVHQDPETIKRLMSFDEAFPNRYENSPALNTLITGKSQFVPDIDGHLIKMRGTLGNAYYEATQELNLKSNIRVRLKGRESILGTISFFTKKNSQKILTKRHIWLAEELGYRASMAFENALIHAASKEAIRSRDEFLSIASHELKTPLQSLTLQNQMRKRNLDKKLLAPFTTDKLPTMIEADLRHLMRINRLIDDMLDISRIRAGKLTFIKDRVEFTSFLIDVLERFRPQLDSVGCQLSVKTIDPVFGNFDMYRIEQVVVNLLTNAMKYGAGRPIKIEVHKKADCLQVHVSDKGPGIKEDDQERIFERFERAISSNEVSGLGLGLYIARQIMEQNGGTLFVRSIIGQGSTFIMELPFET